MRYSAVLFSTVLGAAAALLPSRAVQAQSSQAALPPFQAELRGSPSALAHENSVADQWHLPRFKDAIELRAAAQASQLVPVVSHGSIIVADDVGDLDKVNGDAYRFARPWTAWLLDDLVADPTFPKNATLKVTSLVRSEVYQRRLLRVSYTAARGTTPQQRSSHLTGATVDITTKDMPEPLKAWMRTALLNLERRGLVQATEEKFGSLCFHVMVFPNYQKGTVPCAAACH